MKKVEINHISHHEGYSELNCTFYLPIPQRLQIDNRARIANLYGYTVETISTYDYLVYTKTIPIQKDSLLADIETILINEYNGSVIKLNNFNPSNYDGIVGKTFDGSVWE